MSGTGDHKTAVASSLAPLREPLFRALWIASLVSNIGTWMHEVGEGWLMVTLTNSPMLIGLLETAVTAPMFLLALPAGALADIFDRRRMLLITQCWMLVTAAVMSILTLAGIMTPGLLLALTFTLSVGAAANGPAWQASIPELVTREELPSAIALGSVGFNAARAIGPALGGIIIATAGVWVAFLLNAISFVGVIMVLYGWRRKHRDSIMPGERVLGAIKAGIRYVRYAPMLQSVLVRTGAFTMCASAMWATLPYIARHEMGLSSALFGALIGAFGTGAVVGAPINARLRHRMSTDVLVQCATLIFGGLLLVLAYVRVFGLVCVAMFVGGISWMVLMSSLNTAAQLASPAWVRARAMAVYILIFMGGFAIGSAVWGSVSSRTGVEVSLTAAAIGCGVGIPATRRYRLLSDEKIDLTPSMHWPEPALAIQPHPEHGPVMVTVEYVVDPALSEAFIGALHELRRIRKRNGAIQWGVFRDVAETTRFVETYVTESWAEHLRQHERITVADREIEERVRAYHMGNEPPKVTHYVHSEGMM